MKRTGELVQLNRSIEEAEKLLSGNDAFQFWLFQQRWESLVGDVLASESYIGRRNRDVLYVYVTNSVWMQELIMRKEDILRLVGSDPYGARFRDIRFQIASGKPRAEADLHMGQLAAFYDERARDTALTAGEEAWIDRWTADHVEKDALRPLFSDLMRGALRQKKAALAAGWHPCRRCGDLCPGKDALCLRCQEEEDRHMRYRVVLLLLEKPEATYEEVQRFVPATYRQYDEARDMLIHRYRENYFNRCGTDEDMRRLLALLTHRPFESIAKEEAERILSALPRKKEKEWRERS